MSIFQQYLEASKINKDEAISSFYLYINFIKNKSKIDLLDYTKKFIKEKFNNKTKFNELFKLSIKSYIKDFQNNNTLEDSSNFTKWVNFVLKDKSSFDKVIKTYVKLNPSILKFYTDAMLKK